MDAADDECARKFNCFPLLSQKSIFTRETMILHFFCTFTIGSFLGGGGVCRKIQEGKTQKIKRETKFSIGFVISSSDNIQAIINISDVPVPPREAGQNSIFNDCG